MFNSRFMPFARNAYALCLCLMITACPAHSRSRIENYDMGSGDFSNEDELTQQQRVTTQSPINLRRKMQMDINEFIDLIPADEVAGKLVEYYRNDIDVHGAFNYINGKEFAMIAKKVIESREYREVDVLLSEMGVNIKGIRQRLDGLLGFTKLIGPPRESVGILIEGTRK